MTHFRTLFASLSISVISLFFSSRDAVAQQYVWARSNWGNGGGPNRPVGVMGNGYGGYYVPRNAYGNNYEGRRFTNPNGFIVTGQSANLRRQTFRMRRR